jgi:hypothetical protein
MAKRSTLKRRNQRLRRQPTVVKFPATPKPPVDTPLVPRKIVQEMLKVSSKTIRRWELAGRLNPVRLTEGAHLVYYRSAEVQALAEGGR